MTVFNESIEAGSEYANSLGFTSDKFEGYLWQKNETEIMLSLIMSLKPHRGNFSHFVRGLIKRGFIVKVPTPFPQMKLILEYMGFKPTHEQSEHLGRVDVWVLRP